MHSAKLDKGLSDVSGFGAVNRKTARHIYIYIYIYIYVYIHVYIYTYMYTQYMLLNPSQLPDDMQMSKQFPDEEAG